MPHLNLDLDYFEHRKTLRLIGLLGKGAEVLPLKLWRYTGKFHAEDGRLTGYSVEEIEAAVNWWGESGKAVSALVAVVFLEETTDGYIVHDWLENQGHIAAYKQKGRDMARARWGLASSNASSIATTGPPAKEQQCHSQRIEPTKPTKPRKKAAAAAGEKRIQFFELIPEELRVPKFLAAWESWVKHRQQRRPAYTEEAARRALPKLAAEGLEAAVERIDLSIGNGWQGLFFSGERKANGAANGNGRPHRFDRNEAEIEKGLKTFLERHPEHE